MNFLSNTNYESQYGDALSTYSQPAKKFEDFVCEYLAEADIKPISRSKYKNYLYQFNLWLNKNKFDGLAIERVDILEYKQYMIESGYSPYTTSAYLSSIRQLYNWLEAKHGVRNISKMIKSQKTKKGFNKQPLSKEQIRTIIDYLSIDQSPRGLRNRAIFEILIRTGMRTIELTRANLNDFEFRGQKRILKIQRKGRDAKDKLVVITDTLWPVIQRYIQSREKVLDSSPLIISYEHSRVGDRLTVQHISKLIKKIFRSCNIDSKEWTAHSIRHTTAVNLLKQGATLEQVQKQLGHESPTTTGWYIATIEEELRIENAPESLLDDIF
jgi:integrase/recombinase XerD